MKKGHKLITYLQRFIGDAPIHSVERVFGGHISHAYKMVTGGGSYFVKMNLAGSFPHMFDDETRGLQLLADTHTVTIPRQMAHGHFEDLMFLLMEWIEPVNESAAHYIRLGGELAALHRHSQSVFGLEWDYRGMLLQSNKPHEQWADFFIYERLQPIVELAIKKGYLTIADEKDFEKLYIRIPQLFPEEPPALLHGDLWKGNCLFGADGRPYLVDAGPYYGHREMDIAMTRFFSGFDEAFYTAYNEAYPLEKGWEQRVELCHLYPLLILTTLGPDYRDRLRAAIKKYL